MNNSVPQGLSSSVFTRDVKAAFRWMGCVLVCYLPLSILVFVASIFVCVVFVATVLVARTVVL